MNNFVGQKRKVPDNEGTSGLPSRATRRLSIVQARHPLTRNVQSSNHIHASDPQEVPRDDRGHEVYQAYILALALKLAVREAAAKFLTDSDKGVLMPLQTNKNLKMEMISNRKGRIDTFILLSAKSKMISFLESSRLSLLNDIIVSEKCTAFEALSEQIRKSLCLLPCKFVQSVTLKDSLDKVVMAAKLLHGVMVETQSHQFSYASDSLYFLQELLKILTQIKTEYQSIEQLQVEADASLHQMSKLAIKASCH